ncbi:transposable element Tc3 transposase [Trichonephila clavipes]|uniref:Transposable element Tc3 transposase n=1 Tax=Trichonephila clavipes TaxID=2585209 RepID=A0A8X6VWJ0_TRICX|nr:transposable element Tc3 transposase [Trichonephila clavipes]
MTCHIYRDVILEKHVRLFRGAMGAEFLYMDENARPHRANIVDECLQTEDITHIDWPAYSPDLNPIEHVWDMLGRQIAAHQTPPFCLPELRRALLDEWCKIPQDQIDNLILSMPRRSDDTYATGWTATLKKLDVNRRLEKSAHIPDVYHALTESILAFQRMSHNGLKKGPLRVDELLSKLVSLEEQLASLKLQRKVQSSRPHHHQRSRSRSKSRRRYNPQGKYCYYHFRFGKKCLLGRKFWLFVKDRETGCQFLVDSGADVSILPWTKTKGADFLQKFQLLIDLHNRKLIDGVTNLSIKEEVATIQENNDLSTGNRASKYFNLLKSYSDLTKPNLVNRVVKHGVKHHILTTGQPVYSKTRQLAPDKSKLVKQEFQFMLDNDIIRPSKSQWASPLHLINKKDDTLRPCGDNTISISNS